MSSGHEKGFSQSILSVVGVVSAFAAFSVQAAPVHRIKTHPGIPEHVPGEVVVKFRDASQSRMMQSAVLHTLRQRLGAQSVESIHSFVTDPSLAVVKLKSDRFETTAMNVLDDEPMVVYSEPNYIYHTLVMPTDASGEPNDPDFSKSWSMHNTGQADSDGQLGIAGDDIDILPLWQKGITGSKKVLVAIVDTGIQWDHPDLAANLYTNPAEVAGNKKDDDGNGFVDDIHGWNFVNNTADSNDDQGHGSHCAGVIGAVGNNGVGISGINWNVSLMPVKFLDANGGGTLEAAVNAINYARKMKVNLMSNSWGGGGFSQALFDAIKAAKDQGILFVAAAGNDGANSDAGTPTYPADYDLPNIVSVAATDNKNSLAYFSNYGAKSVDVAAPGVNIYSTFKGSSYQSESGTSMATPHVAGISALLYSEYPTWTYDQIKDRLIKTSTPVQGLHNKVMSRGLVNAYNAFYGIVPPNPDPDESLWKTKAEDIESPHPYKDNSNLTFPVTVPGAHYLRVHFEKVDAESTYDTVTVETPKGEVLDSISGTVTDYTSEYIKGDSLVIRLKSDSSVDKWGFKIDKVQYIMDAPNSR